MACKTRHVTNAARFIQKSGVKRGKERIITVYAGVFGIQAIVLSLKTRKKIPRSW